jgi:hypothetical protein
MAWANRVQVGETASSEGGVRARVQARGGVRSAAARIEPRVN